MSGHTECVVFRIVYPTEIGMCKFTEFKKSKCWPEGGGLGVKEGRQRLFSKKICKCSVSSTNGDCEIFNSEEC